VSPVAFLGLTESVGDLYSVVLAAAFVVLFAFLHALERV
jgi:hypothetical protein